MNGFFLSCFDFWLKSARPDLHHVVVARGCGHVKTGLAGVVGHLEQLGGAGEEEAHHPHVAGDAGEVEGDVATRLTGGVNLSVQTSGWTGETDHVCTTLTVMR